MKRWKRGEQNKDGRKDKLLGKSDWEKVAGLGGRGKKKAPIRQNWVRKESKGRREAEESVEIRWSQTRLHKVREKRTYGEQWDFGSLGRNKRRSEEVKKGKCLRSNKLQIKEEKKLTKIVNSVIKRDKTNLLENKRDNQEKKNRKEKRKIPRNANQKKTMIKKTKGREGRRVSERKWGGRVKRGRARKDKRG